VMIKPDANGVVPLPVEKSKSVPVSRNAHTCPTRHESVQGYI